MHRTAAHRWLLHCAACRRPAAQRAAHARQGSGHYVEHAAHAALLQQAASKLFTWCIGGQSSANTAHTCTMSAGPCVTAGRLAPIVRCAPDSRSSSDARPEHRVDSIGQSNPYRCALLENDVRLDELGAPALSSRARLSLCAVPSSKTAPVALRWTCLCCFAAAAAGEAGWHLPWRSTRGPPAVRTSTDHACEWPLVASEHRSCIKIGQNVTLRHCAQVLWSPPIHHCSSRSHVPGRPCL